MSTKGRTRNDRAVTVGNATFTFVTNETVLPAEVLLGSSLAETRNNFNTLKPKRGPKHARESDQ
jgi:hypothetical protein